MGDAFRHYTAWKLTPHFSSLKSEKSCSRESVLSAAWRPSGAAGRIPGTRGQPGHLAVRAGGSGCADATRPEPAPLALPLLPSRPVFPKYFCSKQKCDRRHVRADTKGAIRPRFKSIFGEGRRGHTCSLIRWVLSSSVVGRP